MIIDAARANKIKTKTLALARKKGWIITPDAAHQNVRIVIWLARGPNISDHVLARRALSMDQREAEWARRPHRKQCGYVTAYLAGNASDVEDYVRWHDTRVFADNKYNRLFCDELADHVITQ